MPILNARDRLVRSDCKWAVLHRVTAGVAKSHTGLSGFVSDLVCCVLHRSGESHQCLEKDFADYIDSAQVVT